MLHATPKDIVEMVAVGEESNNLEKVLIDIANSLEKQTARQLELMVRLLEPLMLLVMAAVTLLVVAGPDPAQLLGFVMYPPFSVLPTSPFKTNREEISGIAVETLIS